MNGLIIGLYGIYLVLVGYNDKAGDLVAYIQKDAPGFLPWIIAALVLAAVYQTEQGKKIVGPFLFLLVLVFVLKNQGPLQAQVKQLYDAAGVTKS